MFLTSGQNDCAYSLEAHYLTLWMHATTLVIIRSSYYVSQCGLLTADQGNKSMILPMCAVNNAHLLHTLLAAISSRAV